MPFNKRKSVVEFRLKMQPGERGCRCGKAAERQEGGSLGHGGILSFAGRDLGRHKWQCYSNREDRRNMRALGVIEKWKNTR